MDLGPIVPRPVQRQVRATVLGGRILNLHDTKGKVPRGAVYIGRPSRWENPYRIGAISESGRPMTRDDVCNRYEVYAEEKLEGNPHWLDDLLLPGGRVMDVVCSCAPLRCHGEWLVAAARGIAEERNVRVKEPR